MNGTYLLCNNGSNTSWHQADTLYLYILVQYKFEMLHFCIAMVKSLRPVYISVIQIYSIFLMNRKQLTM